MSSLASRLRDRIRVRQMGGPDVYTLDLRGKKWGKLGQPTMRTPGYPGWPKDGPPITTRRAADAACMDYAVWYQEELKTIAASGGTSRTVVEAAADYIAHLERTKGFEHNTTKNHRSVVAVHINPRWGKEMLSPTALNPDHVSRWLNTLKCDKRRHGRTYQEDASLATRRNVRFVLRAIWTHKFPHLMCPFSLVKITNNSAHPNRVAAARKGINLADLETTAYTPKQVRDILIEAVAYDHGVMTLPHIAVRTTPNSAFAIAWQLGLATRIDELMHLRWEHVDLESGVVYIPGTKTAAAPRFMPILNSVRPWIERMRKLAEGPKGRVDPRQFVFQVDKRTAHECAHDDDEERDRAPSCNTYKARFTRIELRAGLKFPKRCTHIFRASWISWVEAAGADDRFVKIFVGHASPVPGETWKYLHKKYFVQSLTPDIWGWLPEMPHPDEIDAAVAGRLTPEP